jgi:adenine-specific DNA-methyltransferase
VPAAAQSTEVEDLTPYIVAIEDAISSYKAAVERNRKRQEQKNPVVHSEPTPLKRLNYIGCKSQLLDWIHTVILQQTGLTSLKGVKVADLFAGTGVVSYFFREQGAQVITNDKEPYSAMITEAATTSTFTPRIQQILQTLNADLDTNKHEATEGFITLHYSPYKDCERKFFTVDNARRIDYCRETLAGLPDSVSSQERAFLWASLLWSADAVSNVPAVYGCYLKNFKTKATQTLVLRPIHTNRTPPHPQSRAFQESVTSGEFLNKWNADIVYLDPPYNERQYSKNYFPLNMILQPSQHQLKGKTGIPEECFLSPFCRAKDVKQAFRTLIQGVRATWVFLSYNSESLIPQKEMLELLGEFGTASVVEKEYKRFKSFEYNEDKAVTEYLYCLKKTTAS